MDDEEDIVEYLLSIGALEEAGTDADSGEPLYKLTKKSEEFIPEFTELFYQEFSNHVFFLWQKEFIDVIFDEEGEPMISPNEKAFDEDTWDTLNIESVFVLRQIVAIFSEIEDDEWYNDEEGDD